MPGRFTSYTDVVKLQIDESSRLVILKERVSVSIKSRKLEKSIVRQTLV